MLIEGWVEHALFCPNCGAQPMTWFAANRPVADFLCVVCSEEYELKSQKARLGARVADGAWSAMTARLQAQNTPNLLAMRYDARRSRLPSPGGGMGRAAPWRRRREAGPRSLPRPSRDLSVG